MHIREKIFKILFTDFYQNYFSLKNLIDLKDKNIIFQDNAIYKDRYVQVFEAIARDKVEAVAIRKNKKDEWVIVAKRIIKNDMWIMLYSPTYLACNHHPRIMSSICCDYCKHNQYIRIDDIIMVDDNVGNGTICMEYFIQESKNMNCDFIKGNLSNIDKDHFDRSIHYYKKFGFDVELNDDKSCGTIELHLY